MSGLIGNEATRTIIDPGTDLDKLLAGTVSRSGLTACISVAGPGLGRPIEIRP